MYNNTTKDEDQQCG